MQEEEVERDLEEVGAGYEKAAWENGKGGKDDDGEEKDPEIVNGKNAMHAAHVEGAEIARGGANVEENAAD